VRDGSGRAVAGADVVLLGDDAETARFSPYVVTSDADGIARFADVTPGKWRVGRHFGRHAGPTYDLVERFEVDAATADSPRITLAPPGNVNLRVIYEGEREVPDGTLVRLTSEDPEFQRAGTTSDGTVTIDGLTPGSYAVQCAYWSENEGGTVRLTRDFDVIGDTRQSQIVVSTDR
jgi:hypothetical protein